MTLAHESLEVSRSDGQRMAVCMATAGTPDYDAMILLDMAGFADWDPARQDTLPGSPGAPGPAD